MKWVRQNDHFKQHGSLSGLPLSTTLSSYYQAAELLKKACAYEPTNPPLLRLALSSRVAASASFTAFSLATVFLGDVTRITRLRPMRCWNMRNQAFFLSCLMVRAAGARANQTTTGLEELNSCTYFMTRPSAVRATMPQSVPSTEGSTRDTST